VRKNFILDKERDPNLFYCDEDFEDHILTARTVIIGLAKSHGVNPDLIKYEFSMTPHEYEQSLGRHCENFIAGTRKYNVPNFAKRYCTKFTLCQNYIKIKYPERYVGDGFYN